MKLRCTPYALALRHPFTITRGTRTEVPVVFLELEHDGITARGEASPNARYGETTSSVIEYLGSLDLEHFPDPFALEEILRSLPGPATANPSARAALDIALHDWISKKTGVSLTEYFGLKHLPLPESSFTIGYDSPRTIRGKIEEAAGYPILKIKLGFEDDVEIIEVIRNCTSARLRVDANEGWKTRETAIARITRLAGLGVEFVEQPMPAAQLDDMRWLKSCSPLPLIADENVTTAQSIPALADAFHGINIKLMKSGGIREAARMVSVARASGLSVMIGCMIESSIGITAAGHIAPLCDYADLDGALLVTNDPYSGLINEGGRLQVPSRPGLGLRE